MKFRVLAVLLFLAVCQGQGCDSDEFTCDNGDCIPDGYVCDNIVDCDDGSDEDCHGSSTSETGTPQQSTISPQQQDDDDVGSEACNVGEWECADDGCVDEGWLCDGIIDCDDQSDEDCVDGVPIYDANAPGLTSPPSPSTRERLDGILRFVKLTERNELLWSIKLSLEEPRDLYAIYYAKNWEEHMYVPKIRSPTSLNATDHTIYMFRLYETVHYIVEIYDALDPEYVLHSDSFITTKVPHDLRRKNPEYLMGPPTYEMTYTGRDDPGYHFVYDWQGRIVWLLRHRGFPGDTMQLKSNGNVVIVPKTANIIEVAPNGDTVSDIDMECFLPHHSIAVNPRDENVVWTFAKGRFDSGSRFVRRDQAVDLVVAVQLSGGQKAASESAVNDEDEWGEDCDMWAGNDQCFLAEGFMCQSCQKSCYDHLGGHCYEDICKGCLESREGVGCEVSKIEQCVCEADSYCCDTQYDHNCVQVAIDKCGCGVSSIPQYSVTINLMDHLDVVNDRRAQFSDRASDPLGFFPCEAELAKMNATDEESEELLTFSAVNDWLRTNSLWAVDDDFLLVGSHALEAVFAFQKEPDTNFSLSWRIDRFGSSDFDFPNPEDKFYGQHEVQMLENGNLLMLDNGIGRAGGQVEWYTRGLELELNFDDMTATAVWQVSFNVSEWVDPALYEGEEFEYLEEEEVEEEEEDDSGIDCDVVPFEMCVSGHRGSTQRLENGNTCVLFTDCDCDPSGRGYIVEADPDGNMVSLAAQDRGGGFLLDFTIIESIGGEKVLEWPPFDDEIVL